MIEGAIKNLFHNPTDAFYTGRVMDFLFDGIRIDCGARGDDKFTAAVCMQLEDQSAVKKIDDNYFGFSMFGGVNDKQMKFIRKKYSHHSIEFKHKFAYIF